MSVNRERLEKKFREEYEKLNEKQRVAVDTIDGPVMVIAGPGTGKTQILACRIGKILLDTDTLPENILCLTYTDAGVLAMRKRLQQFIGPDAYKVSIYTFHAFCNDVIQDNLGLFEKTALDPVSDLERIELFKELIDSFPKGHPLKRYRGDVYFEINNLESLFSTMKREGWTPAFLDDKITEYLAGLPEREEFVYKTSRAGKWNKGDLKPAYHDEVERMEKLRAAVGEFDHFQQLMRQRNRYDFDDMINWVIRAFEENSHLLADYQERYQYILVDEYQDTSGTQNRLVELLISYWDKPNVFVVGDDDQSIYRFQGANVENMLSFAGAYRDALVTVVLKNNYRSTQPILDLARTLISRNEERLVKKMEGLSKELTSSGKHISHLTHPPVFREYETQREEMAGIAREVQALVAADVSPGRIGIIYKENKYGEELARYFNLLEIPVYSKRNLDILTIPLAQKIVLLLKYLASEHDVPFSGDEMLFEILHADWFGIPPLEIAKLSMEAAGKRFTQESSSLRVLLQEKLNTPPKDLFSHSLSEKIQRAAGVIEQLIADVPNDTLQHLFEKIIRTTGILDRVMQAPDKHWQLRVLTGLFDFIKEETRRNPYLRLQDLVNLLGLMETEKISMPLVQVSGTEKGVNLLTAHGAKGLEFEYVFFAGCNASVWEKKRKPGGGYKLPDTIFHTRPAASEEEELRRLFYVALTRAEQHLFISYSRFKNDGKELEPSMFIAEILDHHDLPVEKIPGDPAWLDQFVALSFHEAQAPEIEKLEEEVTGRILEKFVMNVTALNNYLNCPLEFYYKNIVRIPSPKNEAAEFGSAVHYALEKLFRKMRESGKDEFPPVSVFIADFEWYMHRHRESFTKEQFDRRLEYGREILTSYYHERISRFSRIVSIELTIRNVTLKGVLLKGKLDKLEFDGKSVNIVDYKTGDPDKAIAKLKGPSAKLPAGGDYWRQAVFYKILVDHYEHKDWKAVSTEFDFVEPDKKKNYRREKLVITPEDIAAVTAQVLDTWEKIKRREFYTGCGREDCHWCHFVKNNHLAIAFHELQEEEETES